MCFFLIGLERPNRAEVSDEDVNEKLSRLLSLKMFLQKQSAKAALSLFWHGGQDSEVPKFNEQFFASLKLLDTEIDMDFDKEEDGGKPGRKPRAA